MPSDRDVDAKALALLIESSWKSVFSDVLVDSGAMIGVAGGDGG